MKCIAVLLAGGSGKRLGGNIPKQFLEINGLSVLEHSLRAFASNDKVDEIFIVGHIDYLDNIKGLTSRYGKVTKIMSGGAERYFSTLAAIEASSDEGECLLLFHDSVRPLVTESIINGCIDALSQYNAVGVAVPATDTILVVDEKHDIKSTTNRSELVCCQTPQGFRRSTIEEAYRRALADKEFTATDDCSVVFRYMPEEKVHMVEGDTTNIKITYPGDLRYAELLLEERSHKVVADELSR